jgi:protein tyrosine/serine phosphatase
MTFINIPMEAEQEQGTEKIQECLDIITDKARQPIFVHCHGGKDRTSLIFAAYRIKYDHWGIEDAYKEMLAYGYNENFYNLNKSLRNWYDYVVEGRKQSP